MILTETVESINQQLIDHFGVETESNNPIWRVVWAPDQFEKRLSEYSRGGLLLLFPEVIEAPKYKHIGAKYVLERLVVVPEFQQKELGGVKKSYEPIWVFEDDNGNPLPPVFWACKFAVDCVYSAQGQSNLAKYKDDWKNITEEGRQQRIKDLEEELFGNESFLKLRTVTGEAVVVPESTQNKDVTNGTPKLD